MKAVKTISITGLFVCLLTMHCPLNAQRPARPGDFDFYVFTLSWSPQFCAEHQEKAECHVRGNNFVVHGLWPQWKNGTWPQTCSSQSGPSNPRDESDVMADVSLVEHEWAKHGTCSGLSVADYFQLIRTVRSSISTPDIFLHFSQSAQMAPAAVKAAFLAKDPQLSEPDIVVGCANNTLVQVQICITKDGTPTACSGLRDCRAKRISVLPVLR